ncbi:MAG: cation:proton antiporter [Acholeplasmataceae bacterium]|nr:cation:proton antiporter [Acholeplasmataceae bacterium]
MIYASAVSGYTALLFLAGMILVGHGFGKLAERFKLPEVTGFIISGILMNLFFINILPNVGIDVHFHDVVVALEPVITIALGFVSFIIGTKFWLPSVKKRLKIIILIVLIQMTLVVGVTTLLMVVFGKPIWFALLIGGISAATAPAPIIEITKKFHAKGPVTNTLFPIVGIDNVIGIALFLFLTVFASSIKGQSTLVMSDFIYPLTKIGVSLLVGTIAGLLLIYLNKHFLSLFFDDEKYETYLVVSVGVIILTTLLAEFINVSPFIAAFIAGAVFTNSLNKETYKYETSVINHFIPPLITAFFVIAGAELSFLDLFRYGGWAILYVIAHAGGKYLGAYIGSRLDKKTELTVKKYLPTSVLTQGGFEIFLAGSVALYVMMTPEESIAIKLIVLTSVLIIEFFAPLLLTRSLFCAKEAKAHIPPNACLIEPTEEEA